MPQGYTVTGAGFGLGLNEHSRAGKAEETDLIVCKERKHKTDKSSRSWRPLLFFLCLLLLLK